MLYRLRPLSSQARRASVARQQMQRERTSRMMVSGCGILAGVNKGINEAVNRPVNAIVNRSMKEGWPTPEKLFQHQGRRGRKEKAGCDVVWNRPRCFCICFANFAVFCSTISPSHRRGWPLTSVSLLRMGVNTRPSVS